MDAFFALVAMLAFALQVQIARGYAHQPGMSAERFIADQDAGAPEFKKLRAEGEQQTEGDDDALALEGLVQEGVLDQVGGRVGGRQGDRAFLRLAATLERLWPDL